MVTNTRARGPARLVTTFAIELEVVTPLHIGTGETLTHSLDFIVDGNAVVLVDAEAVLAELPEQEWRRLGRSALEELAPRDRLLAHARRRIPLVGVAGERSRTLGELHPCIKDAYGRPYVPGSSLKGALRTALAVELTARQPPGWVDGHLRRLLDQDAGGRRPRPEFAAQAIERDLFGGRPNTDLLRALRPTDLAGAGEGLDEGALEAVEVGVFTGAGAASSGPGMFVETLRPGTRLGGTLALDEFLFSEMARELNWRRSGKRELLVGVVDAARRLAEGLIARERAFFSTGPVAAWYVELEQRLRGLDAESCLLWLGWGTGWTAKTLGELLLRVRSFEDVAQHFNLRRGGRRRQQEGDEWDRGGAPERPFPASRRLIVRGGQPALPLGWVRFSLRPA